MNKSEVISCTDMILNTFSSIEKEAFNKNTKFISVWKKVVTKINGCGQKLYEHSSLIEIKNGILLIEADHPGWIQLFQMNSKFIVKGISMYAPEMDVKSLAFRLKGSNALLHNVDYEEVMSKEKEIMRKKYENDEKIIQDTVRKVENECTLYELPPELLSKFESMKSSVLTKNENK